MTGSLILSFTAFRMFRPPKGSGSDAKIIRIRSTAPLIEHKVIANGPRQVDELTSWRTQEFELVGQFDQCEVLVNGVPSARHIYTDKVDRVDPGLVADRMIHTEINTSLGLTVTRDIYAFSHSDHQNYYIYEYTFDHTGIYDSEGNTHTRTLNDVYFYWQWRYGCSTRRPTMT
ncbi:MAG: hypothetical protein U5N26_08015 [Candidatus Marinimicrobia bacterium]|nr:hypothetical protein [Candidatus Neomarinimicrobiota bacterium]